MPIPFRVTIQPIYKLDFGLQYTAKLSKKDELTIGLSYSLGHEIGGEPLLEIVSQNTQTGVADTTSSANSGNKLQLEIPHSYGVGFMYNHNNKVKVGVDYNLQQWSKVKHPVSVGGDGAALYQMAEGMFNDRHKITLGTEICPGAESRSFIKRIRYRAGVSYTSPYLKIGNQDGPKEFSASVGFGIPIMNAYNSRSILNISGKWVNLKAGQFITENTFMLNIGLTFNERWFAKWKVE